MEAGLRLTETLGRKTSKATESRPGMHGAGSTGTAHEVLSEVEVFLRVSLAVSLTTSGIT